MLRYRVLSVSVLIPIILGLAYLGGVWFLGLVLLALALTSYEYATLLKSSGSSPSLVLVIAATWLFVLDAGFPQVGLLRPGLTAITLGSLTWALVRYERGHTGAVADWAWTAAGSLYLGWTGAHFVLTRNIGLPPQEISLVPVQSEGLWWTTLAFATAWLSDAGAYFIGRAWGRHRMTPRVSPYKSWEGYVGGIVLGVVSGVAVVPLIWVIALALGHNTALTLWDGLALGTLIGVLAPLGDLVESMIKRHAGAKDSGQLIPGHGGVFDRVDSLLWAGVIAYYYATWIAPHTW